MPIDLERAELKKKLRGYDPEAVDRLLHGAAKSLQELLFENAALREECERMRQDAERTREKEETLREVLVLAQRAADETRSAAQKQAEATLEEARQLGLSERMATQQKLSEMRWEIDRLRAERLRYVEEFRTLLERHQRELSNMVPLTIFDGEATTA